jgi:prepilin-type N-terminal cleavage/methylation domain-containing protein/prepilin-type processing-associated H-X9-DG protein
MNQHSSVQRPSRSRAFTLVELLVVIGIIAVLVGILVPTVTKARKQANTLRCLSTHRQLMTAFVIYTTNWRGAIPWTNWGSRSTSGEPYSGWLYDAHHMTNASGFALADLQAGSFWSVLHSEKAYRCPGDTGPWLPQLSSNVSTYVMNGCLNGLTNWSPGISPSNLYQLTDFAGDTAVFWEIGSSSNLMQFAANDGGNLPDQGITIRHSKGTTISFIDGHAETWSIGQYTAELNKTGGTAGGIAGSQLWRSPRQADGGHTSGNPTYVAGPAGTGANFEYAE